MKEITEVLHRFSAEGRIIKALNELKNGNLDVVLQRHGTFLLYAFRN